MATNKKAAPKKEAKESAKSAPAAYTYTSFNYFKATTKDGKKLPGQLRRIADGFKLNMNLDLDGKGAKYYDIVLPEGKTSDGKPMWFNREAKEAGQNPVIFIANEAKLVAVEHVTKEAAEAGKKASSVKLTPEELRSAVIAMGKSKAASKVAEAPEAKAADKSLEK